MAMIAMTNRWVGPLLLILGLGCTSTPPGAHPRDMSAAEHRREAAELERRSKEQALRYDPKVKVKSPRPEDSFTWQEEIYNPTEEHAEKAKELREQAKAHQAAAAALDRAEERACRDVSTQARAECPMLGRFEAVEETDSGIRIQLAPDVSIDEALVLVRCHLARASARGIRGTCAFSLPGLRVERGAEAHTLVLEAQDEATRRELIRRTK